MSLRNNVSTPMEETDSVTAFRKIDRLDVTFKNCLKVFMKRILREFYWLVFGQIPAWIIVFLLFNDSFAPEIYNKEEIITFIAGCVISVAALSYFQLKRSALLFPPCLVISHQVSALMFCSYLLKNKHCRNDFESNRPQWIYIGSMQFTLTIYNMITETIWKRNEPEHDNDLTKWGIFQPIPHRVDDRRVDLRATLFEAEELSQIITVKNIVEVFFGRNKFHNFLKLFIKGNILFYVFALNLFSGYMGVLSPVVRQNIWFAVTLSAIFGCLLTIAFLAMLELCLKLLRSFEKDDTKLEIFRNWCRWLYLFKIFESAGALILASAYIQIYPSQVLFIAKLLSFIVLAATILCKLSSCLK